jgi:tetratricopeptide (TPR) repeat protein
MRSKPVRAVALCLLLPALGRPVLGQQAAEKPASQDDLLPPARILKVMTDSKLKYEIGPTLRPDVKPVEELSCLPRLPVQRVVIDAKGEKSLRAWEPAAKAAPHFMAAEKLFSEEHFPEATEEYRQLLALDPDFGPGWLYAGDIPFGRGDYEAALKSYRKAIALDSTLATAHRFAADALLKLGRLDDAESEYVQAIAFDPSYDGAWEGLQVLGSLLSFKVVRPDFSPPEHWLGERQGDKVSIVFADSQKEWLGYVLCKAVWRNEEGYRRQRGGSQAGKDYAWSTAEERDCLESYLIANVNASDGDTAKMSPLARHLKEVAEAGLLDGFLSVAVIGKRCPIAAALLPDPLHADAERYIRAFVVVRPKG